ncbi:MAG: hypothetical protein AMXMBFR4_25560 [Candidatus Hydrogenedentota bacterium]
MKRIIALSLSLLCLSGCYTFMKVRPDYNDVPVEDLKQVALEIERQVSEGNREPELTNRGAVVVSTDEIRQSVRTRAARSHLIKAFLQTGHACEMKNGTIAVLRTREYKKFGTSRDRDRNALLVLGENTDRWAIYEGIVKASNFRPKTLPAVQRIFYEARLEYLDDGAKFEEESGNVAYKGGAPATP